MSYTIDVLKGRYKNIFIALIPLGLLTLGIVFSQTYLTNQMNGLLYSSTDYSIYYSVIGKFALIMLLFSLISIFLQFYTFGIIYTQVRAYVDRCVFTIKDSFLFTTKRLGSFITNLSAIILLAFGSIFILFLFFIFISFFIFTPGQEITYRTALSLMYPMLIGYIGYIGLLIFFGLKFYFSRHIVMNYQYGGLKALSYSNSLTKGFKGRLFGYTMMFVGISIIFSLIRSVVIGISQPGMIGFIGNTINNTGMSMGGAIFTTVVNTVLSLFVMIYMILVFINIDSIKKNSSYLKDELMIQSRDIFYEYCIEKNMPSVQQKDQEPNIIE